MAAQGTTLEEMATMTGISLNTLKARSAREGWKEQARAATEVRQSNAVAVAIAKGQMQPSATSGTDTLALAIKDNVGRGRLGLSKWAAKAGEQLADMTGEDALANHQVAVSVATVTSKLDPAGAGEAAVSLQFFSIVQESSEDKSQVIDV